MQRIGIMLIGFASIRPGRFKFQVFAINLMPHPVNLFLQGVGECGYDFKVLLEGIA
jgi:hypothetical protein